MTARDYGTIRARPASGVLWTVGLIGAIPVVALAAVFLIRGHRIDVATAQAWDIKGAPCAPLTAAQFAATRYHVRQGFEYDGVVIARRSGHVNCQDVKQGGGTGLFVDRVCQFTSPTVITVTTRAGAFYFFPGEGQPATVVIHNDVPRCVKASNFTVSNELERLALEQAG